MCEQFVPVMTNSYVDSLEQQWSILGTQSIVGSGLELARSGTEAPAGGLSLKRD